MALREKLEQYIDNSPVICTHSHHCGDKLFAENYNLCSVLQNSYADWIQTGIPSEKYGAQRVLFLHSASHNSYFTWLSRGIASLYGIGVPLTAETWDTYDRAVREAHAADAQWHIKALKANCRFERVILDAYWDPGSDLGCPELFVPAYRIDSFLYGYSETEYDADGQNCYQQHNTGKKRSIDEFIVFMRKCIEDKCSHGHAAAFKLAIAYERNLNFLRVDRSQANRVFESESPSAYEVGAFQSYVVYELCAIAAEMGIPIQIHTGLGQLDGTNALCLKELIAAFPHANFVLFHMGYPWMEDIFALVHNFSNVHTDLCWLPLISPYAAIRALNELLDIGCSNRISWGCDAWTPEESMGAKLAIRYVLSHALESRIKDGFLTEAGAIELIEQILFRNAKELYKV